MAEPKKLALKLIRFVGIMIVVSVMTAAVLILAVPDLGKWPTVISAVGIALLVAMYDMGLFKGDFEI
ncbi:hypothetical protein MJO47_04105 [Desulfuromonas sp. KJ2020]|uniref:hypothetical protein n=1 Tax=Desulfuromonas sp. KJ2020 TaxID=2919173 RepID=UPI0020A6F357|nr:hypothetical protein [Desulfuromonas sp. KJ2020]MCP3176279.1 hypothetical protein [Desulfuromonas sp. KJ2020]